MMKQKNMTPMIYEKTRDGEVLYDVFSRLVKERIIFLSEEVTTESATTIAASLLLLNTQSKTTPIKIYINSPGGLLTGLFTIYDTMNFIDAPVHTICIGEACSAAAVILAAGTKGERKALPNSEIMIHELSAGAMGKNHDMKRTIERFDKNNERLLTILAKHTGKSVDVLREVCKEDHFMTAEEALEFGIIDSVFECKKQTPKRPKK
jgi:ATP-dependent Clp protease protease subunit